MPENKDLCTLLTPLSPLADVFGGNDIVPGVLHGIDAYANAEWQVKQYRKAKLLKASVAEDHLKRSMAYNAVGSRRIQNAMDQCDSIIQCYDDFDPDRTAARRWNTIVKEEVVPEIAARLQASELSSGELSIWLEADDNICDAKSWQKDRIRADLEKLPELAGTLVSNRKAFRKTSKPQLNQIPPGGVPHWKVLATRIVKILVRVAIEICKTWRRIVSKIVEIVWELVEKWVTRKIYGWCRDGKPVQS